MICDLGNVLLHFDHKLIEKRVSTEFPDVLESRESAERFVEIIRSFETGNFDSDEFLRQTSAVFGLDHSEDEERFSRLWSDIFWPNSQLIDVLQQLHGRLVLIALSNTNPLHIGFARRHFPEVFDVFDHAVFSYDVGCVKPDIAIYRHALDRAAVEPEETLYFDDIAEYVDIAAEIGIHAYQYISVPAFTDVLRIYNILTGLDKV